MDNIITIDKWDNYKDKLEQAYFSNGKDSNSIEGICIKNNITRDFENREIVEDHLNKGKIDEIVVAWKAGTLKEKNGTFVPREKEGNYYNGYGRPIEIKKLDEYITFINKKCNINDTEDFSSIYKKLISEKNVPDNFGSVYIINLIYFLTKGKYPVYDSFAHKALKALYMKKAPFEIFSGIAPGKYDVDKVINMYNEFLWLLTELFGTYTIDRKQDRALWVYGHATDKFSLKSLD